MTAQQEKKLDAIHELLAGTLEKKGLIHKVYEMEAHVTVLNEYKEKDKALKNKAIGGLAVFNLGLGAFWHWLIK